jgi:hypothetical protein
MVHRCCRSAAGGANGGKGKEYTKVHTNDLAMSALNSNGDDDSGVSPMQHHRSSGVYI